MKRPLSLIALPLLILIIAAALVIASGCGEPAAAGAEETLNRAMGQFAAVGSYHAQVNATIEMSGDASKYDKDLAKALPLNLTLSGQIDMDSRNPEEVRMKVYDFNLDGIAEMIQKAGPSGGSSARDAMSAGMMSQFFKDMEVILIKDTFYIKTAGIWMNMNLKDLPDSEGADFSCLFEANSGQGLTINQWGGNVLKDVEELDEEELDGVKTRHFRASIDSDKAVGDLEESMENMKKCGFDQSVPGVGEDAYPNVEDMKTMYRTIYEGFDLEFWVDDNLAVHRMSTNMEFNIGDVLKASGEDPKGMESITMKISGAADLSRFGEDFNIAAPEKTIPFKDLMDELEGPSGVMGGQMT